MAVKLGLEAKIYYLTTGTRATWGTANSDGINEGTAPANLSEITKARDVTIGLEKGVADVTTRGNNGWRAEVGTLKDGTISFDMIYDEAEASVVALLKAFLTNTTIAVAALSGANDEVGVTGLWADFEVTGFEKGEPLEEGQTVSVELSPALSSVAPEWVEVTGP